MVISGNIVLHKSEFDEFPVCEHLLTVSNPAYVTASRHSTYRYATEGIDEFLQFITPLDKEYYSIPRNFPRRLLSPSSIIDARTDGESIESSFRFVGSPREYQVDYLKTVPKDYGDFILEAPCGHGKTFLALYLASKAKVKTFILVPTYYLAAQWEDAIQEHLPDVAYKILTPKDMNHEGVDVGIITYGLAASRDFSEDFRDYWGLVLADEAHRTGATTYYPVLAKVSARRRIALTATFRRHDGMEQILKYSFGSIIPMKRQFPPATMTPLLTGQTIGTVFKISTITKSKDLSLYLPGFRDFVAQADTAISVYEDVANVRSVDGLITDLRKAYKDGEVTLKVAKIYKQFIERIKPDSSSVNIESYLAANGKRYFQVLMLTLKKLEEGRRIVLISKRRGFLERLNAALLKRGVTTELVVGKAKNDKDLIKRVKKGVQVVLGIATLANEGLDSPLADTLIIHLPIQDIEQPIGRIERDIAGKKSAEVLYLVDDIQYCKVMYRKSLNYLPGTKVEKAVPLKEYMNG